VVTINSDGGLDSREKISRVRIGDSIGGIIVGE
jgi:hypothetical protein